jgi:hypothetical protein
MFVNLPHFLTKHAQKKLSSFPLLQKTLSLSTARQASLSAYVVGPVSFFAGFFYILQHWLLLTRLNG